MLRKGFLAGMLVAATACVQADENHGFEFGLGVTRTNYEISRDVTGGFRFTDHTMGYSAFVGYRFIPQLAVEAHYFDGGTGTWGCCNARVDLEGKAYGASVLGMLPLGTSVGVFARLGYMRGDLELTTQFDGDVTFATAEDEQPFYGIGIKTMLDEAQVRLEYNRSDFDLADLTLVQLSVAWLF
jgi:hypothetical protein